MQAGDKLARVNQDTRLNNRVLDLRTPANQAIFRIKFQVEMVRHIIIECYHESFVYIFNLF